ncbi:MAG: hypothetical protein P1V13_02210 [Rhizobiaceae bacterium]|nr:hypothetical protein [Rhizobiaceae bacterium]
MYRLNRPARDTSIDAVIAETGSADRAASTSHLFRIFYEQQPIIDQRSGIAGGYEIGAQALDR